MNSNSKPYKILLFGDSHLRENILPLNQTHRDVVFDCCSVSGATAQGAVNPTSQTNALNVYIEKIKNISLHDFDLIGTMLGEVDCGFVIWYRAQKYNISIDEQLNTTVNNLFKFINTHLLKGTNADKIVVLGSILPTITDDARGDVAHLRSTITVSQKDRTHLTLKYNNLLKSKCDELGFNYIDITSNTISSNGRIDQKFLSLDATNHHLDFNKVGNIWYNKIIAILNKHKNDKS